MSVQQPWGGVPALESGDRRRQCEKVRAVMEDAIRSCGSAASRFVHEVSALGVFSNGEERQERVRA